MGFGYHRKLAFTPTVRDNHVFPHQHMRTNVIYFWQTDLVTKTTRR